MHMSVETTHIVGDLPAAQEQLGERRRDNKGASFGKVRGTTVLTMLLANVT